MKVKNLLKKIPLLMDIRNLQVAFSAPLSVRADSKKKIKSYKSLYEGKRCFIVGNGPSLTASDLSLIKNEISFAANTIYKIFSQTEWRPTFYCIQDEKVLQEIIDDSADTSFSEATFVRMYSSRLIDNNKVKMGNVIYIPIWNKLKKNYSPPFSARADKLVFDGSMVTYLSLQLAVYMGFSEIYLIGMDHNFPYRRNRGGNIEVNDTSIPVHFWESAENNGDEKRIDLQANYQELGENSYLEAKRYSKKNGRFKIYNVTRGGKLEVFERKNLEDVL